MNKKYVSPTLATLAALLILATGCATTKAESPALEKTQNQDEHEPEVQTKPKESSGSERMGKGGMMNSGMMEKMDMNQMMGMMNQCMAMHKDGKICGHQMMEKCQANMDQKECMKMMTNANTQIKKKEKTKKK